MLVRSVLESSVRQQINRLLGFEFQDFVIGVLYQKYGAEGFANLRPVRDGGCDGLIHAEKCAIACYGPQSVKLPAFEAKISDDYQMYCAIWQDQFPHWRFFVNFELGEDHISIATSLYGDSDVLWGLDRLCMLIAELVYGKRIVLYRHLHIAEDLFANDIIRGLLDDLIQERNESTTIQYAASAPDIEMKVRANVSEADVDSMLALINVSLDRQADVDTAIRVLGANDVELLKSKVVRDYAFMHGSGFLEKFRSLRLFYAAKYNSASDDILEAFIDAFLIHMFSQCHIGSKPGKVS